MPRQVLAVCFSWPGTSRPSQEGSMILMGRSYRFSVAVKAVGRQSRRWQESGASNLGCVAAWLGPADHATQQAAAAMQAQLGAAAKHLGQHPAWTH